MNLKLKHFYLLVCILATFNSQAQTANDQATNYLNLQLVGVFNNDTPEFYNGIITLLDGTVLTGDISLNHVNNKTYNTIIVQDNDWVYIPNKTIKDVVLNSDQDDKTKFTVIKEDAILYREVYKKNEDVSVYDSSIRPFENRLTDKVYVKENNTVTNTFDFWTSGPKKDLVNYINNRDGSTYRNRDFKSLDELFAKL